MVAEVLYERVSLVRHIEDNVLEEHRLILLPLCVRLGEVGAGGIISAVARGVAAIVASCAVLILRRVF